MNSSIQLSPSLESSVICMTQAEIMEAFDHLVKNGPNWAFMRPHSDDFLDIVRDILCDGGYEPDHVFTLTTTKDFENLLSSVGLISFGVGDPVQNGC